MSEQIEQGNGKIVFWLITISLLVAGAILLSPFIPALLWATVLSVLLHPYYKRLRKRFNETVSALGATLLTAFVIVIPLLGLATLAGLEIYSFATQLTMESQDGKLTVGEIAGKVDQYLEPWLQRVGLGDFTLSTWINENKEKFVNAVTGPAILGLKRLVITVVTLVIALLTMFFMLRDGHRLLEPVSEIVPLPRERCLAIIRRMGATIRSVFISVVGVAVIQGLICGLLYWILGVPSPAAWMALTIVLAMIPLLGAPIVYVPAALYLFLSDHPGQALILVLIGFFVVSQIDNLLRPVFISM
ncbi:MAG: AI-2E family transporter, partial [Armatimonadetes bacterium]|nr:AI-2E family transporter [Armatimonadota bacterium]